MMIDASLISRNGSKKRGTWNVVTGDFNNEDSKPRND